MSTISLDEREDNNKSDELYDKLGSCPSQLLRDPVDNVFQKFKKKEISEEK